MKKIIEFLKRQKNPEIKILLLIILMGFIVRLYKINSPVADWHSFRQADTASVTRTYIEGRGSILVPKYHDMSRVQSGIANPEGYRFVEFPLYNIIHAALSKTFPFLSLEIWGRLISIVSALISTYVLFLIGRKYISNLGGIIAAGMYALLPYNIYFTRVILPEPIAVMLVLLSLWFFIRFTEVKKNYWLIFAAVCFSLSILVKPYTIFYALPILYLAVTNFDYKKAFLKPNFIIAGLIALVPLLLWRYWMKQFPEGIPFWKWTFNGDGIRFKAAYWFWIYGERLTKLILGYWGIVPFFAGIASWSKKYRFLHFMLIGVFLFTVVFATANVRHDYYQSVTIPGIILIFALGFIKLWDSREFNTKVIRGLLVFTLFMVLMTGAFQVKEYYKINHPELITAGDAVDRLTPKGSVIIAAYNGDTAFLYQTKRRGWPVVELPIEELVEEGAEYYVSVNLNDTQTIEFMNRFPIVEKTGSYVILKLK